MKQRLGISFFSASLLVCAGGAAVAADRIVVDPLPDQAQVTAGYQVPIVNPVLGISSPATEVVVYNSSVAQMGLHNGSDVLAMMNDYDTKQMIAADKTYALIFYNASSESRGWLVADFDQATAAELSECMNAVRSTKEKKSIFYPSTVLTDGKLKIVGYQISNNIISQAGHETGPMYLVDDIVSCTNW